MKIFNFYNLRKICVFSYEFYDTMVKEFIQLHLRAKVMSSGSELRILTILIK